MTSLNDPVWLTAPSTRRVMQALNRARPDCARFVGGCVRNALLGVSVADIDIATQLNPQRVTEIMREEGCAVHPTGIEHGTLTIVADGAPFEITTLRRDIATDGRRAVVAFTEDWVEDAQRRDFGMNALYADAEGKVYDPTGGGLDDIEHRRICFVGDAHTRIKEDYLRILRFFRFFARYGEGEPDPTGLAACADLRAGLQQISAERIWSETGKLLASDDPRAALHAMQASGVFTELYTDAAHPVLLQSLITADIADNRPADALRRFLAMYWKDASSLASAARRLKVSNEERARIVRPAKAPDLVALGMDDKHLRAAIYRNGASVVLDQLILNRANDDANTRDWLKLIAFAEAWTPPQLPVSGDDALAAGFSTGPAIGNVLRTLEDEWVASDFSLERTALLERMNQLSTQNNANE